ncbi:MAG: hypothetical protein V4678_04280 [Patescibacteria group bacterium]
MTYSAGEHHVPYTGYTDENLDDSVEGFSPEDALGLGIPVDYDSLESHKESGRQVSEALSRDPRDIQALIDAAEHAAVNEKYGSVICGKCSNPSCPGCKKG